MILRIVIIVLLLSGSVFSQAKVGTTGAQFLQLFTSARSAGMADIGVMVDDADAFYYNPAVIGLVGKGRWYLPLMVTPNMAGSGIDYYTVGYAIRPSDRSPQGTPSVGMAFDFLYLTSGDMVERSYNRGVDYVAEGVYGTGRTFTWKDYKFGSRIGLGWSGNVDFAIGLALNSIEERAHDYKASSWSVDLGAFLGVPLGTPDDAGWRPRRLSFGISYSNLGPDLRFIVKAAPLPKIARIGAAVEISRLDDNGRVQLEVLPAIEYELNTTAEESLMKFGLELTYREIVSGRVGYRSKKHDPAGQESWGFSLSTLGLRSGGESDDPGETGFFRSLIHSVIIEFHYAHVLPLEGFSEGTDHFGLGLTF